jgi:hypothetical protein
MQFWGEATPEVEWREEEKGGREGGREGEREKEGRYEMADDGCILSRPGKPETFALCK